MKNISLAKVMRWYQNWCRHNTISKKRVAELLMKAVLSSYTGGNSMNTLKVNVPLGNKTKK